jgi:general secretion pathway protein B
VSLILDALNRSRQDADPVPGLGTQHPTAPMTVSARQTLPWIAQLVALILIGWLVWERDEPPESVSVGDISAPVAELSRNVGSAVTSVTAELQARAALPPKGSAAVVVDPEPVSAPAPPLEVVPTPSAGSATAQSAVPEPASVPVPAEREATESPSAITENAVVAELYQKQDKPLPETRAPSPARDTRPARVIEEQPVDIEAVLRQAQEEIENASLAAHPAPFLESLSQQKKDDIPTIYYQQHDYASQASLSSVILNGKTLKAGGSPLAGMKVDEILSDSVVLSYRGTQFRLRALNSWINL